MFAAYRQNGDQDVSVAPLFPSTSFPAAIEKTDGEWLQCTSFKEPDANEVVHISSSESSSDVQLVEERSGKACDRRKRRKHKRTSSKKNKHKRSRSKSPKLQPDVSESCVVSQGKKTFIKHSKAGVFSEKTTSSVIPVDASEMLYFDKKQDIENLQFGGFYKQHVAQIHQRIRSVLGGSKKVSELIFGPEKKPTVKNDRYFGCRLQYNPTPVNSHKDSVGSKLPEFLPLEHTIASTSTTGETEYLIFDTTTHMYRIKPADSSAKATSMQDVGFSVEANAANVVDDSLLQENKRLNRLVGQHPDNVELWVDFINFQDRLSGLGSAAKSQQTDLQVKEHKLTTLGLLERKVSIIEKALQHNQKCLQLKVLRIKLGQEFWDREKLKTEWKNMEFAHQNEPEMWQGLLSYSQRTGSGFKFSQQLSLYERCLKKLHAVSEGKLISHPPLPCTELFMAHVVAQEATFLKQTGHTERFIGLIQGILEFNLFTPDELNDASQEKFALFEQFWDSRRPRIGEAGAVGWKETLRRQLLGQSVLEKDLDYGAEPVNLDEQEEMICKQQEYGVAQIWLALEQLRSEQQWLPWTSTSEPEDPERIVMFDDIKDSLVDFKNLATKFFVAQLLLSVCGASLVRMSSSTVTAFFRLDPITVEGDVVLLKSLDSVEFSGLSIFLNNCFAILEKAFPEPYRTYFVASHIKTHLKSLASNSILTDKEKYKEFKRCAKEILKQEDNRSSLTLFHTYAKGLADLGCIAEAVSVLQTAIAGHLTDRWLSLLSTSDQLTELLSALCSLLQWVFNDEIKQHQTEAAVKQKCSRILTSAVCYNTIAKTEDDLRNVQHSDILKACKTLKSKVDFCMEQLQRGEGSAFLEPSLLAAVHGSCFVNLAKLYSTLLLCTLSGFSDAMLVLDQCIELLQSSWAVLATHNSSLKMYDERFVFLDRNLELMLQSKVELAQIQYALLPFSPVLPRLQLLSTALEAFPLNQELWSEYSRLHLRGDLIVKLRRLFDHTAAHVPKVKESEVFWLAALTAELKRLQKFREVSSTAVAIGESNRIRHLFQRATLACSDAAFLWRLWIEFESAESSSTKNASKIFFQAARYCASCKELYIDAVKKQFSSMQSLVDLMNERGLRVRLPLEELELLLKAADRHEPDSDNSSEDDTDT